MKDNIFYKVLSWIWRNTFLKRYRQYKVYKDDRYWREHRIRNGSQDPDKIFYVIRRRDLYCGLFSLFLTNLVRIDEAKKKGYIPIVDMQNDFNIYLKTDKIGRENAWEYYFRQPSGYTLDDIKDSRNVIIGSGAVPEMFPYLDVSFLMGKTGELEYWRKTVRENIVLSDTAKKLIDKEYRALFDAGDKVLGVKCRGTDYSAGKPKNHPIQPTPLQMLSKAEEIFEEQKCTKVFLSTEDVEFYKVFKERFKDRLITNKTDFLVYQGGSMGKEEYGQENGGYDAGMEYLISTMLLAKCSCLCAGCVSGTVAALLLTEGYEYVYLFDLGIY